MSAHEKRLVKDPGRTRRRYANHWDKAIDEAARVIAAEWPAAAERVLQLRKKADAGAVAVQKTRV